MEAKLSTIIGISVMHAVCRRIFMYYAYERSKRTEGVRAGGGGGGSGKV